MFFVPFYKDSSAFYSAAASAAGASSAGASVASSAGASAAALAASSAVLFGQCLSFHFIYFLFQLPRRALASAFLASSSLASEQPNRFVCCFFQASNLASASASPNAPFATPPMKVFLHVNAFAREDVANSVGRLCTFQYPVSARSNFKSTVAGLVLGL